MKPHKEQSLRCAIYTRKSSEEGLEQDFNSLHAQREACEAYIRSQQGDVKFSQSRARGSAVNDAIPVRSEPFLSFLLTKVDRRLGESLP
jgi:hypothetical protein